MSEAKPELPWQTRLQFRVLIGTLKMLRNQIDELPDGLIDKSEVNVLASRWQTWVEALYASTTDAPHAETQPKTVDVQAPDPAPEPAGRA